MKLFSSEIEEKSCDIMKLAFLRVLNIKKPLISNFQKWLGKKVGKPSVLLKALNCGLGRDDISSAPKTLNLTRDCCLTVSLWRATVWSACRQSWSSPCSGEKFQGRSIHWGSSFYCSCWLYSCREFLVCHCFPGSPQGIL